MPESDARHVRSSRPRWFDVDFSATHLALALLRILYHLTVFWLVLDLWTWREVAFFGGVARAVPLLLAALLVNALLVVGLHTRVLLVVNWLLLRVIFQACLDPYTPDEIVENFSFILMFAPRPRALSLDSLRAGGSSPLAPVPTWFTLLVFTGLALLYGDGLAYKLSSRIWTEGSAFWLGASVPHFVTIGLPHVLERVWLMKAATYTALGYEILFPLVAFRGARAPLIGLGILVHVGSALFMPLPQFGVLMVALLLLFVRWERLFPARLRGAPAEEPRNAPGWPARVGYALAVLMAFSQLQLNLDLAAPRNALSVILGTRAHPIFIDWHFTLSAPLLRFTTEVDGREVDVPSFDKDGHPTVRDRYWKVLGFSMRTGREPLYPDRYLRGWFKSVGLRPQLVHVFCRDVRLPNLEVDFKVADELRARPWTPCGTVSYGPPAPSPAK